MTRKDLINVFVDVYEDLKPLKIAKNVVVNFNIPKDEQDFIFGYCINDMIIDEVKGEHIYNGDDVYGSEISLNPRLTKFPMETIINTIAHELVHTIKGCDDHNKKFKTMGKKAKAILNLHEDIDYSGTVSESELLLKYGRN